MLQHRLSPLLLAAATAGLLSGCTSRSAVTLSLSATPRETSIGDSVRLVLTMTNPGRDTLHVAFEPGCAWRVGVRHATEGWRAMPVPDPCAALAYRAEGSVAQRVERRGSRSTLQLGLAAPPVDLLVVARP